MPGAGVRPNIVTYNACVGALAGVGEWERAIGLLREARQNNIKRDARTYTGVIAACGNGGQWSQAVSIFDEMLEVGIRPDAVAYMTMVVALGQNGEGSRAMVMLREAQDKGYAPTLRAVEAVLSGCEGGKSISDELLDDVAALLRELVKGYKHEGPRSKGRDPARFNAVLEAYGSSGRWRVAVGMLGEMRSLGIFPDRYSYDGEGKLAVGVLVYKWFCSAVFEAGGNRACGEIKMVELGGAKGRGVGVEKIGLGSCGMIKDHTAMIGAGARMPS